MPGRSPTLPAGRRGCQTSPPGELAAELSLNINRQCALVSTWQRGPTPWWWQQSWIWRVLLLWQGGLVAYNTAMVLGLAKSSWVGSWHVHRRCGGAECCACMTSGVRLAVVIFCCLLLRCVGAVGGADGSDVVASSGVSMVHGWPLCRPLGTRPRAACGVCVAHERGSYAPAVQSGKMVKSHQTLAMAVGAPCLLLKSRAAQNLSG